MRLYLLIAALGLAWAVTLLFGGMEMDRALLFLAYAGERPEVARIAGYVTYLGDWRLLVPLTLAGAAWLAWRGRVRDSLLLLAIAFGGRLLVTLQKDQSARLRPEEFEHLAASSGMAFPSGHTANATIVYLALAVLLSRSYRSRAPLLWAATWLSIGVGASRVLLGVHWPTDVIGGWAFGLFWTLLLLTLAGADIGDGTPARLRHSSREGERL